MSWIVELEPKCWLAEWSGDPGRTLVEKSAKRFASLKGARSAITRARKYRPFKKATTRRIRVNGHECKIIYIEEAKPYDGIRTR